MVFLLFKSEFLTPDLEMLKPSRQKHRNEEKDSKNNSLTHIMHTSNQNIFNI